MTAPATSPAPPPGVEAGDRAAYRAGVVLEGVAGSVAYGLDLPGSSDLDLMGVFVEPPAALFGPGYRDLRQEGYVRRTAAEGRRSEPTDQDLTAYSLRKYLRLAADGNPSVLVLLYLPEDRLTRQTETGRQLRDLTPALVSQRTAARHVGYLNRQMERMAGGGRRVGLHGYDVKYASHALRLGLQGVELLTTGRLDLPMPEPARRQVLRVRRGEVPYAEAQAMILRARDDLVALADSYRGPLPAAPDLDAVGRWATAAYLHRYTHRTERPYAV